MAITIELWTGNGLIDGAGIGGMTSKPRCTHWIRPTSCIRCCHRSILTETHLPQSQLQALGEELRQLAGVASRASVVAITRELADLSPRASRMLLRAEVRGD